MGMRGESHAFSYFRFLVGRGFPDALLNHEKSLQRRVKDAAPYNVKYMEEYL